MAEMMVIYQSEDGSVKVDVLFENETMRKIGISEYSVKITRPSACKADVWSFWRNEYV